MINSIESISCSANINLHKINTLNKENAIYESIKTHALQI